MAFLFFGEFSKNIDFIFRFLHNKKKAIPNFAFFIRSKHKYFLKKRNKKSEKAARNKARAKRGKRARKMRILSEAEEVLKDEIKEKKQIGNTATTRKGKRSYGQMRTTLDLLSGKEKRAYTKAGKVQVSNLYEELIKKEEFEALTNEEQKRRLQYWRTKYSVKEIQKGLGIAGLTYYKYLEKLGIPRERPRKAKAQTIAAAPQPKELLMFEPEPEPEPRPKTYMELLEYPDIEKDFPELVKQITAAKPEPAPAVLVLDGLNVAYNGRYSAEEIRKKLTKIDIILDGEEAEFEIELRISQRKERTE